jgi:AraC-like DNA-binding protein/mannose-6-phosphate isomerase-like protein (cupin superfamily)
MDTVAPPAADPVSDALRSLNVRSTVFCLSELGAPWAFRVEGADVPKFHLVLEGRGSLTADGHEPIPVTAGDLVLLPHGHAHTIADEPGRPATALDRLVAEHPLDEQLRLRCGGDGPVTRLLCGGFAVGDTGTEPTLALVPDIVRLEGDAIAAAAWLAPLLTMLDSETRDAEPGSTAVLAKIADVFLTQAVRIWLVGAERAGLLVTGSLQDGPIAKALAAIRDRPAEPWSLDSLARLVGMSRTSFATRFHALVGESPMRYVAKARLSLAAGYLATTRRSIYEIALLAGYQNESTLSKSFRREFGVPPGRYRAEARHEPAITVVPA